MATFICNYLAECMIRPLEPAGKAGFCGPWLIRSGSLAVSNREEQGGFSMEYTKESCRM